MLIILRPQYIYVETREKKLIRIVINFLIGFGCYPNRIKQTNKVLKQQQQQQQQNQKSAYRAKELRSDLTFFILGTHR